MMELLEARGVEVKFAIHPVAGRMPGHMNVLLAEADIPYDHVLEMDEINPEFNGTDVALVVGANDVVNPAAREVESSPIYGMPVINVDKARTVFVLKRSMASGFAGIENPLFYKENTRMLFGDAKESIGGLVRELNG
jgi:NAD(P) transhydrogenase subunit beta